MVRRDQFALALLFLFALVSVGCSPGVPKKSLSPVVAHLQAKGYQGEKSIPWRETCWEQTKC